MSGLDSGVMAAVLWPYISAALVYAGAGAYLPTAYLFVPTQTRKHANGRRVGTACHRSLAIYLSIATLHVLSLSLA